MFAMAAFMVIAYLIKELPLWFVLPISILAACLAGYDENIGSFLYLSRIIVFFPFYYTGYCLDIKNLQEVLNKTWIKCLSAIFLTDMILYTLAKIEDNYSYIRLFTGRNAYSLINVESCGAVHRLMFYVIAFLMGIAIISLIPNCKVPVVWDSWSKNTANIFLASPDFICAYFFRHNRKTDKKCSIGVGMDLSCDGNHSSVCVVSRSFFCTAYPA